MLTLQLQHQAQAMHFDGMALTLYQGMQQETLQIVQQHQATQVWVMYG